MDKLSDSSFRTFVEQAPLGIAVFHKGKVRFLNGMAMKIWGIRDASHAIGKPFESFIAPSCREAVSRRYQDRLKGSTVSPAYESVGIRQDGTEFHYHVDVALLEWNDGPATIHFFRDISERKQIDDELRSALADLEKRVTSKNVDLSEANIALQVVLDHMEKDRRESEKGIAAKIAARIIPHLNKLKADGLREHQKATVALLEEDLNHVASPFLKHLQGRYPGFTPQEIQVADLIRMNQSSKEIARQMNISANTVDLIRYRIRKKLNINKKKIHLGAYLSSI